MSLLSLFLWSAFWLVVSCAVAFACRFFITFRRFVYDAKGKKIPGPRASFLLRNLGCLKVRCFLTRIDRTEEMKEEAKGRDRDRAKKRERF
jgi:hypothetical protein